MDSIAVEALISGLSGVGGGVVGAGATILAGRHAEKSQRRREHDDAILSFWSAVASFGALWNTLAKLLPADANLIERTLLQGFKIAGHTSLLADGSLRSVMRCITRWAVSVWWRPAKS